MVIAQDSAPVAEHLMMHLLGFLVLGLKRYSFRDVVGAKSFGMVIARYLVSLIEHLITHVLGLFVSGLKRYSLRDVMASAKSFGMVIS